MTSRWSCSKTDKSNCCSLETLFHEVTCEFKFGSRKPTAASRLVLTRIIRVLQFSVLSNLTFMHQDLLDKISILFNHHDPLDQFLSMRHVPLDKNVQFVNSSQCPCITLLWTNFQFCPFITILLTTFVHASRCSERVLDDRRNRRLDKAPPNGIHHDMTSSATGTRLQAFIWRDSGSGTRYLFCASPNFP